MDLRKVIEVAAENRVAIELNANPARLDMDWRHWRRAAEAGVLCVINPDAHAPEHFDFVVAGILSARKGGLRKEDILNTRSLEAVRDWLADRPA